MNLRLSVILLVTVVIGFAACKNNDNVFKPVIPSYLNVVNATTDTLNIFVNGTRQNNTSSLNPGGQSFYLNVPSGTQNYQFKKNLNPVPLFSLPLNLKDSTNYSLYVYGESASSTFNTIDLLYPDTTAATSTSRAQIRFVNASPDATDVNVTFNDTLRYTSIPFKATSGFLKITNGKKIVKVYPSGATSPAVTDTLTFLPGYIYTVFSRGLVKGTGSKAMNLGVVINLN
ncbi:DUF4397 domain-containing protein [Mucilaginibacter sp.]|uniref:DUF4397 domain-containing protein n=1 Tax=Mucilaginibacter sp. TaxID=1882438 RepID=UPI003D14730B